MYNYLSIYLSRKQSANHFYLVRHSQIYITNSLVLVVFFFAKTKHTASVYTAHNAVIIWPNFNLIFSRSCVRTKSLGELLKLCIENFGQTNP